MNRQVSFAANEYAGKGKRTRRDRFLGEMEVLVPWAELVGLIEPHYYLGKRGRPPIGVERMLRLYFLQQWYALADEALEDAVYDSQAMRAFAGIDLSSERVPDATTLLKFRRFLEKHDLTRAIFEGINAHLQASQRSLREGTIVDATIIAAPPSTKNRDRQRDPEMHQAKKGNQWHFGMKAHVGVDANSGLVHTVVATPANVSDLEPAADLLHGREKLVFADAGYTGLDKRPELQGRPGRRTFHIAEKRGKIKALPEGKVKELVTEIEKLKASVRARAEHVFGVLKHRFGYRKVRYKGIEKNLAQLHTLFALGNIVLAGRKFAAQAC